MYTTEAKIEKYLNVDIASSFSSEVTNWIDIVTSWIDRYTGKTFEAVTETRHYDGNGADKLLVDSFVDGTITALNILTTDGSTEVSLTEGAGNDFVTYPLNTTEKNEIVLVVGGSRSLFPSGNRRVEITADFGFSASVPSDIELVATKLVASIINEGLKGGELASFSLGDISNSFVKVDEQADALGVYQTLDMYRDLDL